ncbi:MAG: FMN-binding protein [Desulfobacterales bacterium]
MNRSMAYLISGLFLLTFGCAFTPTPDRGHFNPDAVPDGTYVGSATNGPVKAVVQVVVTNGSIAQVNILKHRTMLGGPAEEIIPAKIVEKQSTNVDAVSGATMSSDAIMNAAQLAIEGAAKGE